jgi:glycine/D-amino acid oxidase-like deaminating enzyme
MTAIELLKTTEGRSIVVLGDPLKNPATQAAQGILCSKGLVKPNTFLFKTKLSGQYELESFVHFLQNEMSCTIPMVSGVYETFSSVDEYRHLLKRIYHSEFLGFRGVELLSQKSFLAQTEISSVVDFQRIKGAFYYPWDFAIQVDALLLCMEMYLRKKGVLFVEEAVVKISCKSIGNIEYQTQSGLFHCEELVLAAGSDTPEILYSLGISMPFQKVAGLTLHGTVERKVSGTLKSGSMSLTFLKGLFKAGAIDLAANFDAGDLERKQNQLLQEIEEKFGFPVVKRALTCDFRFGIRLKAKDRLPVAGPLSLGSGRIWLLTALYRNGLNWAGMCASRLSESLSLRLEGPNVSSFSDFLPSRFVR